MKTACVVRYGAYGDMIMLTPVLRLLKQEGYHVTLNCHRRYAVILEHNPHVDSILFHDEKIPNTKLDEHWAELSKRFDRFINLSESIERGLLAVEGQDASFKWPKEQRHQKMNVNYYDRTLELAGFKERGLNPELYFSPEEEAWAQQMKRQYQNRFWVVWSLSGSSFHKVYPFADAVATEFLDRHSDAMTMTVGDDLCRLLEWDHAQNRKRCGMWETSIRKSLIVCKYANLVVATETGIANGSAAFDTPKIIMLSHSSIENLTKYWENCISLEPLSAECYPCHQLHYTRNSCPQDTIMVLPEHWKTKENMIAGNVESPICTSRLKPELVLEALEAQYQKWKEAHNAHATHNRTQAA